MTVLGCADPTAPDDGWIHREGDQATITCHDTEHAWIIKCNATSGAWTTTHNTCLQGISISFIYTTRFADPHEGSSRWGSNTVTENPLQLQGIPCQ